MPHKVVPPLCTVRAPFIDTNKSGNHEFFKLPPMPLRPKVAHDVFHGRGCEVTVFVEAAEARVGLFHTAITAQQNSVSNN